jgi:hypothetical protein
MKTNTGRDLKMTYKSSTRAVVLERTLRLIAPLVYYVGLISLPLPVDYPAFAPAGILLFLDMLHLLSHNLIVRKHFPRMC